MCVVRLEPVEGSRWEICDRQRRLGTESMDVLEPSQQLKQAQLAITELYQEKMELRKQLAKRTVKTSMSHSREGNVNWLKRYLREAQHMVIQLHEEQRISEEKMMEHFRECGLDMENISATLASSQMKLKGNVILQR
jgi:hypothetical protein